MGQGVCHMDMCYPVILLTERIIVFLYLYANKFLVHTYPQIQYRASTLHYQSVSPLHLSLSYIFLLLVSPVTHHPSNDTVRTQDTENIKERMG